MANSDDQKQLSFREVLDKSAKVSLVALPQPLYPSSAYKTILKAVPEGRLPVVRSVILILKKNTNHDNAPQSTTSPPHIAAFTTTSSVISPILVKI
ncbi:hypothetical protein TrLO_g8624 [Triparma laevis f. longispina]|uniref:Uncharacterized protein n=1 Tax=Triparma laevis f. longispina TaxID=1714387 RepID=A0A9W7EI87_9STRA|nr:hypothetical protein TrLO_g8624 [Triparma laevis f. longispina]